MKKTGKNIFFILLAVIFLIFAFSPVYALAAEKADGGTFLPEGLVPCGTARNPTPCEPCHIFSLLQKILNFFWWGISVPVATLMLAYGGFLIMLPSLGGDAGMLTRGKKVLTNTLIGILIVFFAWLGIDTIIKVLSGQNLISGETAKIVGPWNQLECKASPSSSHPSGPPLSFSAPAPSAERLERQKELCPTCVTIGNVPTKPKSCAETSAGQVCRVDNTLNDRLAQLNQLLGRPSVYWWVTESWPPTVTHQNPCHNTGTCVDANLRGSYDGNPQEVANFIKKCGEAGLNCVYEVRDQSKKDSLVRSGVPVQSVLVVQQITGQHFSVYLR